MAAPIAAYLRFLLPSNLSCRRIVCRRLVTEFRSVQTRPKLSAGIRLFHTRETAHCTQEDRVSRIPIEKLSVSYSRSGGAGGQHVNKVSTKAEVRFHVETADWIPQDVRREILLKNHTRVNKAGELIVTSEISRSQRRNLQDCLQKIWGIIAEASRRPEEPTEEDISRRQQRLEKRNQERLKQKKIHSAIKQSRRVDFD